MRPASVVFLSSTRFQTAKAAASTGVHYISGGHEIGREVLRRLEASQGSGAPEVA